MSRGPREGVYLDATLAVIAQQVEERVDRIQHRRRRRLRLGIAALALTTLGAGAATAAALTSPPPATVVVEVPVQIARLQCVEGIDPNAAAYFAVRYAVPAVSGDTIDALAACLDAHAALESWEHLSPEETLARAGQLLRSDSESAGEPVVQHVSTGPVLLTADVLTAAECDDDEGTRVVVVVPDGLAESACRGIDEDADGEGGP
jgi:hypothetical protein